MIEINSIITVQHTAGNYKAIVTGSPFTYGGITRYPVLRLDNGKPWNVPENLIIGVSTEYPHEVGDLVRLPGYGPATITGIGQKNVTLKFRRLTKFFGMQNRFTTIPKWRTFV